MSPQSNFVTCLVGCGWRRVCGGLEFLDAVEGPTLDLETANLADVLTVHNRQAAQKISAALLSECGFGLSPSGALLRPTTYEGAVDEEPSPTGEI